MALSSDQIATLLSQGAITAAQAEAMSAQSQPVSSQANANASYGPPSTSQPSLAPGQTQAGNIDVTNRPVVQNPDGTISTVRSISANIDGQETLIPTVSNDGRVMSDSEAIEQYKRSGQHLGKFADVPSANSYAQQLHNDQAKLYESSIPVNQPNMSTPGQNASFGPGAEPVSSSASVPPPAQTGPLTSSGQPVPNALVGKNTLSASPTAPVQSSPQPQSGSFQLQAPGTGPQPTYGKGQPLPETDLGTGAQKSIGLLQPEKTLLDTSNTLGYQQRSQLEEQRKQQEQINQMQFVANDTAANMAQKNAEAVAKEQAENKAAWAAAMKRADDQSASIVKRAREIGQRKIDPNRYWNSMDNASQFFAGFSLSLGAMGAALLHTQNYAFEKMKMAVSNDIEAQKADIANAYKSLGIEEDTNHNDLQRAQIDAAYKDKSALEHWENGKQQILAMTSKLQSPIDQQKANMLLGSIDDQIRQNKLGMAQNLYNFETLQRRGIGGTAAVNPQKVRDYIAETSMKAMTELGYDKGKADDFANRQAIQKFGLGVTQNGVATQLPARSFEGKPQAGQKDIKVKVPEFDDQGAPTGRFVPGLAVNETAAKEITEGGALEANAKIVELTGKLMKVREEAGSIVGKTGGTLSPERRAEAERITGELKAAVLKAEGLNRYTKEDNEHVVSAQVPENALQITEPVLAMIGSDPTYAKLKSLNQAARARAKSLTNGGMVTPAFGKSSDTVAKDVGAVE